MKKSVHSIEKYSANDGGANYSTVYKSNNTETKISSPVKKYKADPNDFDI